LQFKIATLIPETPKCDEHINQVLRTFARNIAYCKYRILDSRIKAVYGKLYNLRQPLDLTRCPHRARCYNPRFLMPKNVPIRDGIRPIPLLDLNRQYLLIRPAVLSAIERVCSSQQFVLGQEVDALERELAAYVGAAHAIGCASGTDAPATGAARASGERAKRRRTPRVIRRGRGENSFAPTNPRRARRR